MRKNPLGRKLNSLASLSSEAAAALDALARTPHAYRAGQTLIAEGDRPERVFLLLEGWAFRYKVLPNGHRQILAFLIPGDLCDPHVFILEAMDHSIGLLSDARVAAISPAEILAVTDQHPAIARAFWWSALVDEAILREWLVNLGQRNAYQRLAHLFCELWLRMSQVELTKGDNFSLPLTQEQLGDTIGMNPVHVNRTIQRMRDEGLIKLGGKELTILNPPRLREIAGFEPKYLHLVPRN